MLQTDYTLTWTGLDQATLTWDGGLTDVWWSIYVNGEITQTFYDSGTITKTISLREDANHSIAIAKRTTQETGAPSPESMVLLRPTIKWVRVPAASIYTIYFIDANDSDYEYVIHTETVEDDPPDVYSWRFPANLFFAGDDVVRVRVVAAGSFGESPSPCVVSGFAAGHPAPVYSVTPSTDSDGNVLILDRERNL